MSHTGPYKTGRPVNIVDGCRTPHLLSVLAQNRADRGMASLCIGGGQGGAMLIERYKEVADGT